MMLVLNESDRLISDQICEIAFTLDGCVIEIKSGLARIFAMVEIIDGSAHRAEREIESMLEWEKLRFISKVPFAADSCGVSDIFEYSGNTDYPDPNTARFRCGEVPSDEFPEGTNDQKLCDEDLEALFALQETQVDTAERQETYHEISRYMTENVYWLGLWYDPDIWAVSGSLSNVRISGANPFFNINEWDLTR